MSASSPPRGPDADPSMAELVASIRRSLDDGAAPVAGVPKSDGVLQLDPSMMVPEPPPPMRAVPAPDSVAPAPPAGLVAPAAAAAAALAVVSLVRTLAAERSAQVRGGGPTIEDLVREEIRSLLKEWLDTHLPIMVERLVRAEIERVVGRSVP
jgi:cell pole-organizing protein PopZ